MIPWLARHWFSLLAIFLVCAGVGLVIVGVTLLLRDGDPSVFWVSQATSTLQVLPKPTATEPILPRPPTADGLGLSTPSSSLTPPATHDLAATLFIVERTATSVAASSSPRPPLPALSTTEGPALSTAEGPAATTAVSIARARGDRGTCQRHVDIGVRPSRDSR